VIPLPVRTLTCADALAHGAYGVRTGCVRGRVPRTFSVTHQRHRGAHGPRYPIRAPGAGDNRHCILGAIARARGARVRTGGCTGPPVPSQREGTVDAARVPRRVARFTAGACVVAAVAGG